MAAARPEVTDRDGWVGSPSLPSLGGTQASGRKMVSDSDSFGEEDGFRQLVGGQDQWLEGNPGVLSLSSLSFLHSTDLLRAEYLISTPFISSTDGTGQHWPTRRPIRPRVQQRCFSKHGSLTATRIALSWSRFCARKGVWQRLPAPPPPQDPLRPAPAPRRWVGTTCWRLADAPSPNHMKSPVRPTCQLL